MKAIITFYMVLVIGLSGCEQPPQPLNNTESRESDLKDVRQSFIAQSESLLTERALVSIFASSDEKLKPKAYVKNLNFAGSLVFAQDGTLYYIDNYKNVDTEPTKNSVEFETAIFVIKPDGENKLLAESGTQGHVTGDDGSQGAVYNNFGQLSISSNGNLVTVKNEGYPFEINANTGVQSIISFKTPDGRLVQSVDNFDTSDAPNYPLSFPYAQSDTNGNFIVWNNMKNKWYRYRFGEKMAEITDLYQLPSQAYLHMYFMNNVIKTEPVNLEFQYYILGSDGYIYSVELGNPPFPVIPKRQPDTPDRIVRIGDAGLSSLRKEATRVTIAEFKPGTLTGSLAFNAKGELAVGAINTIYLISPTNTK